MNITTTAMNIEQAHLNMIENQIRAGGVHSQAVLETLTVIRREHFVPSPYRNLAFSEMEIPLPHNENMLMPQVEALVLQAVDVTRQDSVLEIGAGSGYMAALLAHQAAQVCTVEIEPVLAALAEKNLMDYGIKNARVVPGNGAQGWRENDTLYDVIVISGSLSYLPDIFTRMLQPGGRLIAFVGEQPFINTQLIKRLSESEYSTSTLFETSVKPLREQMPFSRFRF